MVKIDYMQKYKLNHMRELFCINFNKLLYDIIQIIP